MGPELSEALYISCVFVFTYFISSTPLRGLYNQATYEIIKSEEGNTWCQHIYVFAFMSYSVG